MSRLHKPLINKIQEILTADTRVVAAWLEGSIARGEDDDFSDIDLWVAVKDARFNSFIADREQFAAQLGPVLSILYPKTMDQPADIDSFQIIFADQPSTLTLDVDVQQQSRKFFFTKDSAAEECHVLFDKGNVIKYKPFNPQDVEEYVRVVFADVSRRFWHLLPRVTAALQRADMLEALSLYMQRLEDYVTLHRLMLTPEKVDWGFKDIEYDLPEDVIKEIYYFWPPANPKALQKLTAKLAHRFAKQAKIIGKRLRLEPPRELIKKMLTEF